MKHRTKRKLSILLAFILCMGMLSGTVLAKTDETACNAEKTTEEAEEVLSESGVEEEAGDATGESVSDRIIYKAGAEIDGIEAETGGTEAETDGTGTGTEGTETEPDGTGTGTDGAKAEKDEKTDAKKAKKKDVLLSDGEAAAQIVSESGTVTETYSTLQDAVNNARTAEDTVELLMDRQEEILVSNDVTIDLGGHTLTGDVENTSGSTTVKNTGSLTIKNGTVDSGYYGIYSYDKDGKSVTNLTVENVKVVNTHYGIYIRDCNAVIKNSVLTENIVASDIGSSKTVAVIEDCEIFGNVYSSNSVGTAGINVSNVESFTMRNCDIYENESRGYGAVKIENGSTSLKEQLLIVDCNITDNKDTYTTTAAGCCGGGLTLKEQNADTVLTIRGCTITGNRSHKYDGGGLYLSSYGTVIIEDSNICDNKAGTSYNSDDIAVYMNTDTSSYSNIKVYINAPQKEDYSWSVKAYEYSTHTNLGSWMYLERAFPEGASADDPINPDKTIDGKVVYLYGLTAVKTYDGHYVVNTDTGTEYDALEEALREANPGETLKLIHKNTVADTVSIDKNIILDLNGYTVTTDADVDALFHVDKNVEFTLINKGEEEVSLTTASTEYSIWLSEGAALHLSSGIVASNYAHVVGYHDCIYMSEGAVINLTDPIEDYLNSIYIALEESIVEAYNNAEEDYENVILTAEDSDIPEDFLSHIIIKNDLDGELDKTEDCGLKVDGNSILLYKYIPVGIYLDGAAGEDDNEGTIGKPVRTFEKAKDLLKHSEYNTIYVLDTVTVSGENVVWSLYEDDEEWMVKRYSGFTGNLVRVTGSLTLTNITFDGNENVPDTEAMLSVENGTLDIEAGTVLKNNQGSEKEPHTYHTDGAVACAGSDAAVTMNGGTICNNTGYNGAAVGLDNGAEFVMNGGTICENESIEGAVCVVEGSVMTLTGGTLRDNTATYGGAINLGTAHYAKHYDNSALTMTGGVIRGNTARANGGGIFIQCETSASITNGKIINNHAFGGSVQDDTYSLFGGGGIYVNGWNPNKAGTPYNNGVLNVENLILRNNTAGRFGGGFGGCLTSTIEAYDDTSLIYHNAADRGAADVFNDTQYDVENSGYIIGDHYIADTMRDGSKYIWTDDNGKVYEDSSIYQHTGNEIKLTNANAEKAAEATSKLMASGTNYVLIEGNSSGTSGGGIGSNGIVYLSKSDPERKTLTIGKKVEGSPDVSKKEQDDTGAEAGTEEKDDTGVEVGAEEDDSYTFRITLNRVSQDEEENEILIPYDGDISVRYYMEADVAAEADDDKEPDVETDDSGVPRADRTGILTFENGVTEVTLRADEFVQLFIPTEFYETFRWEVEELTTPENGSVRILIDNEEAAEYVSVDGKTEEAAVVSGTVADSTQVIFINSYRLPVSDSPETADDSETEDTTVIKPTDSSNTPAGSGPTAGGSKKAGRGGKTSDPFRRTFWMVLLCASGACVAFLAAYRRRKDPGSHTHNQN